MRFPTTTRHLALALAACTLLAAPARALTVSGGASTQAGGAPNQYTPLTLPESTTGPVESVGTCSRATGQAWISAASSALALAMLATGGATQTCVASSYASGNSGYFDQFRVESASLPSGTLVDVTVCVRAAFRHGIVFGCGGSVSEGVTSTASITVSLQNNGPAASASGTYTERWNCFDGHDLATTGLLAGSGGASSLTLAQVPVGTVVTVSANLSATTGMTSFSATDVGRVEMALVFGYASAPTVRLVSTTTAQELDTLTNCSAAGAAAWLPPAPGVLDASLPLDDARLALSPPAPNPARGPARVAFVLPQAGPADLGVFDLAGARVATLARGPFAAGAHARTWDGRDDAGRAVRPGLYWIHLVTPAGRMSRMLARL